MRYNVVDFFVSHQIRNNWIRESEMAINRRGNLLGGQYRMIVKAINEYGYNQAEVAHQPKLHYWTLTNY